MPITATRLTKAAGVCAAVAGAIFSDVAVEHGPQGRPDAIRRGR